MGFWEEKQDPKVLKGKLFLLNDQLFLLKTFYKDFKKENLYMEK